MTAQDVPDDQPLPESDRNLSVDQALLRLVDTVWDLLLDQSLATPRLANLTLTHLRLLYWIRDRQPVTPDEIHKEFGIAPSLVAPTTARLMKRGLLSRCGDLVDRPSTFLYLTDLGLLLLDRTEKRQINGFRRMLKQLSSEELQRFAHGLILILDEDAATAHDLHANQPAP